MKKKRMMSEGKIFLLLVVIKMGGVVYAQNTVSPSFDYQEALEEFRKYEGSEKQYPEAWKAYLEYKKQSLTATSGVFRKDIVKEPIMPPGKMGACGNIDFENGDFSGWMGYTGYTPARGVCCNAPGLVSAGVNATTSNVSARHTIVTGAGVDPCGGFPVIAPALPGNAQGSYSVRLGNSNVGFEAERLITNFIPTPDNNIFTYQYAVVIQDPSNPHTQGEKPYFEIAMFDENNDTIPCTYYFVSANEGIPGFVNSPNCTNAIYKPWTTVSVDLSAYVGTNVTIRFTTADCDKGAHYGYAYLNCECFKLHIIGKDTICEGDVSTLVAPYEDNNTYKWSGPSGFTASSQAVTVDETGRYSVVMTSLQGCQKQLFYDVFVVPNPVADFSAAGLCSLSIPFTENSSISSGLISDWSWSFGDGQQSSLQSTTHTYSSTGTYNVSLTVKSKYGCESTISKPVSVRSAPEALFDLVLPVCEGAEVTFNDKSTVAGDVISSWTWYFDDASPASSQQSPKHTYTGSGNYNVKLLVESSSGCKDSTILPLEILPMPGTDFSSMPVCLGFPSVFNDKTTITGQAQLSYLWNFGEPASGTANTSTVSQPSHNYATAGKFNVSLVVITDKGCIDTVVKTVDVYPAPSANFSAHPVCLNSSTAFKDASQVAGDIISLWQWNFGEPSSSLNTSVIKDPSHAYGTAGVFNVKLVVTTASGCKDSLVLPMEVHPIPQVNFLANEPCVGDTSRFENAAFVSTGAIALYAWNFGDPSSGAGNISGQQHPLHLYGNPGDYSVILTATTDKGCQSSFTKNVKVKGLPRALFVAPDVCLDKPVRFTDSSISTYDAIKKWEWDFGDGTKSTFKSPSHKYAQAGTYNVSLTVTASAACKSTLMLPVNIFPLPVADFSIDPQQISVLDPNVEFDEKCINAVSGSWDFGDGTVIPYVQGEDTEHKYAEDNVPGGKKYYVTLQVMNEYGCPAVVIKPLEIDPFWSLYIPDAFTPDGDIHNETFFAKGEGIRNFGMEIFDRWGNHIFECYVDGGPDQLPCHWDGKVQGGESGEISQQDIYVYRATFTDLYGNKHFRVGHVSLVK